jgi:hypothetical protein
MSAEKLHLLDLQAWRDTTIELPGNGWAELFSFSVDGSQWAIILHERVAQAEEVTEVITLFDVGTGKPTEKRVFDFRPSFLSYVLGGEAILVYGQPLGSPAGLGKPGPARIQLLDASSLQILWDMTLDDVAYGRWCEQGCGGPHDSMIFAYQLPAVVLSHDASKLYIAHADEEKLTTFDLERHTKRTVELSQPKSWLGQLIALTAPPASAKGLESGSVRSAALSPDGKRLYITGKTMSVAGEEQVTKPLGLRVVDPESGQIVASSDTEAEGVVGSMDGAYLLLYGAGVRGGFFEPWTDVVDAASLSRVKRLERSSIQSTRTLGGQEILLATRFMPNDLVFEVLDPHTFEVAHSWSATNNAWWIARP